MTTFTKNSIKHESFRDLLNKTQVFELFEEITLNNYVECSPGFEREMVELLNVTFKLLNDSKMDTERLGKTVKYLVETVFKKSDQNFWFNMVYKNYKRVIKPRKRYSLLNDILKGDRILDVGCGDGLLSEELRNNNYEVFMTDVLDYRDEKVKDITFKNMQDTVSSIPFPDKFADTSILFSVLHHVDGKNLDGMIDELKRVSKRIIIEENCYCLSNNDKVEYFENQVIDDQQLQKFLSLSSGNQLRYLMISDYFSNSIGQGILEMNFPFEFRTIREWKEVFSDHGLLLRKIQLLGFQKGNFTRSCDVLFVLDVPE